MFSDTKDKEYFLSLFEKGILDNKYQWYAWAIMDNHYHFLIRLSEAPLAPMMRRLNSMYALYSNKKYKRRGYLFPDRYKSIATQDQNYIEELVRYIHLNPYRAGLGKTFKKLADYRWCGH